MQYFLIHLFLQTFYTFQTEEPPETCRTSVEINELRNVASCWLYFGIFYIYAHLLVSLYLIALCTVMDNNIYYCTYCICELKRKRIKIRLLIYSHYELREPLVLATGMHNPWAG